MTCSEERITARAIIFDTDRPRHFEMREFEIPATARQGETLIRLHLAGVCGSDLHTFAGRASYGVVIPGHEMVGEVVSVGEGVVDAAGRPLKPGDRVVPESTIPCLRCPSCRGFGSRLDKLVDYTACEDYQLWGAAPINDPIWMNGAYAEYLQAPRNAILHRIDPEMTDEEAVLMEPLAVGVKAVLKAGVSLGDIVLVQGPGPIGLTCVIAASFAGAAQVIVTGMDCDRGRLDLACELGATDTICVSDGDLLEQLLRLTGGRKADRVIDTTGALPAFEPGVMATARNGVFTCIGGYPKGTHLPVPQEYCLRNKIDLRFSHNGTNCYQLAYEILRSRRFPFAKMVSHRFPLASAQQALEDLSRRDGSHVKVVLEC